MSNYTYIDCRISGSDFICDRQKIVSGNAVKIRAIFDESWSGLSKYFVYRAVMSAESTGEGLYTEPIDISEIFNGDGFIEFGFVGRDNEGNVAKATNVCTVIVEKGAYIVNPGARADALSIIGRFDAVERSVLAANNTADEAKTKANDAKASADSAVTVSGEAKTIAGEAKNTASDAKTSAENAVNVSNDAKGIADEAKTKASEAKTSAENAVNVSNDAKDIADEAKTKASDAKTTAGKAVSVSNDAKGIADEAKTKSETAVGMANAAVSKANDANATAKEVKARADRGEFDGKSVYHTWYGSVLEVNSASGTSSMNLKGEPGERGDAGPRGERGEKGDKGDKGDAFTFDDLTDEQKDELRPDVENFVESKEAPAIAVNENLVDDTKFFFAEGYWSGNNKDGFTHTKGVTGSLTYDKRLTDGKIYLVEFDTSYKDGEFGVIGIGATPKSMMYNGSNHIAVFLYAKAEESGACYLRITPYDTFDGTLSNIAIYEVDETGTVEKELTLDTVVSKGHNDNYGFYNVLIGYNNMANNPTSTRTICIGRSALAALKAGHRNISIGTFSLSKLEEGDENVAIGADCAFLIKKGKGNIVLGKGALYKGDELNNNVVIGHSSMKGINPTEIVKDNTVVGYQANYYNGGSGNTCVGMRSGWLNSNGNFNTSIGYNTIVEEGLSNTITLGANARAKKSNQMVLGGKGITEVVLCGDKLITFAEDGTLQWNPDAVKYVPQIEYNSTDGSLQGRVYVVNKNNVQTSKELRVTSATDSIPIRNNRGNFYVGTPSLDYECTNKKYVDDLFKTIEERLTKGGL